MTMGIFRTSCPYGDFDRHSEHLAPLNVLLSVPIEGTVEGFK